VHFDFYFLFLCQVFHFDMGVLPGRRVNRSLFVGYGHWQVALFLPVGYLFSGDIIGVFSRLLLVAPRAPITTNDALALTFHILFVF